MKIDIIILINLILEIYDTLFNKKQFCILRKELPMITNPHQQDIPVLKSMWKKIFDDDDKLIDEFFAVLYEDQNTLIWKDNDVIAAMLYMIPYRHGVYLYALGTLPEYRKQGIMSALINKACDICKNIGAKGVFLVPSDITMNKYYEKFGFIKAYCGGLMRTGLSLNSYETRIKKYVEFIELHENENTKYVPDYFMLRDFGRFDIKDICGYIPF